MIMNQKRQFALCHISPGRQKSALPQSDAKCIPWRLQLKKGADQGLGSRVPVTERISAQRGDVREALRQMVKQHMQKLRRGPAAEPIASCSKARGGSTPEFRDQEATAGCNHPQSRE